jgi:lipopolysaccharide/colanic/teichoic acid biosynthesis glycosyltransferase
MPATRSALAEQSRGVRVGVTAWSTSRGKRLFDCVGALLMAPALLPCMALIALAVKFSSPGPVLFRQCRVGQNGREFELLKFRSMASAQPGPTITRSGDARVTRVGKFLRRWKLDELSQLINVIRGDMSLVGPRPELPKYIAELSAHHRRILEMRPGITGAASTNYRDEEQVLAQVPPDEVEDFYVRRVLRDKAEIDWEYAGKATLLSDVGILLKTLRIL